MIVGYVDDFVVAAVVVGDAADTARGFVVLDLYC